MKTHEAENCQECGALLKDVEVVGHEGRQVFDTCAELVKASRRYALKSTPIQDYIAHIRPRQCFGFFPPSSVAFC